MKYVYYPGCSLEKNASSYHDSAMAIAGPLDLEFAEINDWNCCGATEYIAIDLIPAYALIGRNLAIAANGSAELENNQLVAPCSACFLNLKKADHYMGESPDLAETVNEALGAGGLNYDPGSVEVRHLLDIFVKMSELNRLKKRSQNLYTILKSHHIMVVSSYGLALWSLSMMQNTLRL